jgi:hypothetical protein
MEKDILQRFSVHWFGNLGFFDRTELLKGEEMWVVERD